MAEHDFDWRLSVLGDNPWFRDLPADALEEFARISRHRRYADGGLI